MNKIKFSFSFILIDHLFCFTEKYYNMEVKWFPDAISCETASKREIFKIQFIDKNKQLLALRAIVQSVNPHLCTIRIHNESPIIQLGKNANVKCVLLHSLCFPPKKAK